MPSNFPQLRAALVRYPWAMLPDQLEVVAEIVERRAEGVYLSGEELATVRSDRPVNGTLVMFSADTLAVVAAGGSGGDGGGGGRGPVIAVINVFGVLAQRMSMVDDLCGPGGTSTERVTSAFRQALSDPSVTSILLNFDSPGGNVYGIQALADEIFNARGQKPIIAQVNSLAASAAYWLACSADEIVMTPGAEAGSIGVYALHRDVSKAADAQGVKFTFVSAGKYKVEGNQYEPLSEEAAAAAQELINSYYADFTSAVARGRGVAAKDVVNGFGEGRVVKDKQAVKLGMADRVAPMDDTLRRLSKKRPAAATNAEMPQPEIFAETPPAPSAAPAAEAEPASSPEPLAEPANGQRNADAFRRRRHAHRLRAG